jgi:hypothetical protein
MEYTCKESITSTERGSLGYTTRITPPLFIIKVSVLSHDSERSCICVSGIDFTEVSTILLLCFVAALMAWWLSWRGGSHGVVLYFPFYCFFIDIIVVYHHHPNDYPDTFTQPNPCNLLVWLKLYYRKWFIYTICNAHFSNFSIYKSLYDELTNWK